VNRNYVVPRGSCVFLRAENPGHDTRQPLGPEQASAIEVWDSVKMSLRLQGAYKESDLEK